MEENKQPPESKPELREAAESPKPESSQAPHNRFEVWKEYEAVAMHFNDLLIRLRTQALGGVAAVAVLAAVIVRGDISATLRWEVLVAAFFMLLLFWVAVYYLDTLYYNRLLEGAVDAIVELETSDKEGKPFPGLQMSTRIEKVVATGKPVRIHKSWRVHLGRRIFYGTVFVPLILGLAGSLWGFCNNNVTPVAEGIVTDEQTAKPIEGATIVITPARQGSITNTAREDGTFFVVMPSRWQDPFTDTGIRQTIIMVSAKGYKTQTRVLRSARLESETNYLRFAIGRLQDATTNQLHTP